MKKVILIAAAMLSTSAFALNTSRMWHSGGERLKIVGKQTTQKSGFETKQSAVDAAVALVEDLKSGDMSKATKRIFRNSFTLWDDDKCRSSSFGFRTIEREMAKGNFEVISINVGSYFTGNGTEVFSYSMRYYAPCIMKDRD